ncbi:YitT family protein [Derxia gummosa]|uniref:YitT family protein n=1 Tax=Derxia gummosa DSM 723 TaxID=1121388 RepID=A0A8B6X627_9BURK|nr:YitT family protein [Derxia gummosa]
MSTPNTAIPGFQRHTPLDDAQAIFTGVLFVSLGLLLFRQAGLLSGGTAGIAFLLHYASGGDPGLLFFVINLPFWWLSWRLMGRVFTLKTFAAVALLSLAMAVSPSFVRFEALHPAYSAVAGGLLLGAGCLFLARHKASLGGVLVTSLWAQERLGMSAGRVQLGIDAVILASALFVLPLDKVGYALLGSVAMNVFLAVNHKPGRYRAA